MNIYSTTSDANNTFFRLRWLDSSGAHATVVITSRFLVTVGPNLRFSKFHPLVSIKFSPRFGRNCGGYLAVRRTPQAVKFVIAGKSAYQGM